VKGEIKIPKFEQVAIHRRAGLLGKERSPVFLAEALQKLTHNLFNVSRILSSAKNFYFWR
jgi:hypothetical protein